MTLVITRALGLITVQDLGRPGHMHEAVPPGGALVPELLVAANSAAHNSDGEPALEIMGTLVLRAEADLEVASDRDGARALRAGESITLASEPARVTYLAVRGGIASPLVLDGRGTLLVAHLGRVLRAGDRIVSAGSAEHVASRPPPLATGPIRVLPGPDHDAFAAAALDVLFSAEARIATTSDRVGTRLEGVRLPRRAGYRERSRPMVRGAIEVPSDGAPIVLGPEHPTTGGYPVIGVVASADLGRLHAIRLGGNVRFRH
jgi:allophanate hydrolase subunit 2